MFYVAAIGCGVRGNGGLSEAKSEGEANASATDDGLVGEQRRSALREGSNEDLRVQIPGFHPGWQVSDDAFEAGFCWEMTTSPVSAEGSLERRRVNAGEGLAP